MLGFKQFLNEVFANTLKKTAKSFTKDVMFNRGSRWSPDKGAGYRKDKSEWKYSSNQLVSKMSTGHHIYKAINPETKETIFHAYDPATKRSTLTVQGRMRNGVLSKLYLAAHESNKLPAHEFYHHLLKHHVRAIVADSQSEGARKVWGKLAKKRNVNIHGWHKGKAVNVKFGEDETHDVKKGDPSIRDMQLVAHIKD